MTANHRIARLIAIAFSLTLTGCGNPHAAAVTRDPGPAQTISLDLSGPRPTADLRMGSGAPVTAIFDTGAAASVVWMTYARDLNLPNQGSANAAGPGGTPVEGFRTTISGRLGEAEFSQSLAVALDMTLPLPGISAIISPTVFSGRLVRFDFARSQAVVMDKTPENLPLTEADSYSRSLNPFAVSRLPTAQVRWPNGQTTTAHVDTGAAGGLILPLELAETLTLAGPLTPAEPSRMVGVVRNAFQGDVVGDVRVGPLTLANPRVKFVDGLVHATIGMEVLRNTVIVLDPEEYRSWILAPDTSLGTASE